VDPRGKTVLLTGATGGLGRAIAEALAGRGATLTLSSRQPRQLAELAAGLAGVGHHGVVADLAEPDSAEQLAAEAAPVDILVANAGLPASGRLDGFTTKEIERALRVNLEAPIRLTRALLGPMQERDRGHFVFISSLTGKAATARQSLYAATKFGLRGFAFGLRQDLWRTGIGVSVISPGFVREAGMFADSGAKPPPGLGTTSPRRVAAAVVEAIERDRGEIDVAPFLQRALAGFAHRRPHIAARVSSVSAGKVGDRVARGQSDKR
jgi:short-subunit dehydrogenase